MKTLTYALLLMLAVLACQPQSEKAAVSEETPEITGYDSLLAAQTGADAYGMRKYIFANLIAGPNRSQDSVEAARLQRAHMDNITRMAEAGKLVLAGPFLDDQEVRGIYVFAVETIQEAEELTNSDPAIQAGRLKMELRPWYGSAALMQIGDLHQRLSKEKI